jgi:hypothetical protein
VLLLRRHRSIGAAALVALAVLAAGCSSDGAAPSDPPADGTEPAPPSTTDGGATVEPSASTEPVVPTAAWAVTMTGPSNEDEIDGIAASPDGSLWITGKYEASVQLVGEPLASVDRADIPLARVDADGTLLWARSIGGPGEDNLFDIDADADGAVGTGWFEGTLEIDGVALESAGSTDCVVASFDLEGELRWARSFGGPGPDGCNEVVVGTDGAVTTSLDTAGGWTIDGFEVGTDAGRETVLLRLDPEGELTWARVVSGPGAQRGKALAIDDDGEVAFGGDTVGPVEIGGSSTSVPGRRADAWLSRWTDAGELRWVRTWGGPGADLAKGVAFAGAETVVIGPFEGAIELGDAVLDAGTGPDLVVASFDPEGTVAWVGALGFETLPPGAEMTALDDGAVAFAVPGDPALTSTEPGEAPRPVDVDASALLVRWGADGGLLAIDPIVASGSALPDEIARAGSRLYVDVVIRGEVELPGGELVTASRKDGSAWAIDLAGPG